MNGLFFGVALGAGALVVLSRDASAAYAPAGEGGLLETVASPFNAIAEMFGMSDAPALDNDVNVTAALAMIRIAEHGYDAPVIYRTLFGGGTFDSFVDHPRITVTRGAYTSTAAGAYQILSRTWDGVRSGLPDFSPASQDVAAVRLIRRRGALAAVREGRLFDAMPKMAREWASLPGSPYGQPVISMERAVALFENAGGVLA